MNTSSTPTTGKCGCAPGAALSIRQRAFWKAGDFLKANDPVATQNNAQLWWELATSSEKVKLLFTMLLRAEKTSLWLVNHLAMNWLVQRVTNKS
jgi:hypothetical protein